MLPSEINYALTPNVAPIPTMNPMANAAIRAGGTTDAWGGLRTASNPMAVGNNFGGVATPQTSPGGVGSGLGWNMDTMKFALGGLETIGNIWSAWNAQKLAREQFDYTKSITDTNMANQIKSYNTTLDDRIRARASVEGMSDQARDDYLKANRL